jgi:hypothetical protein
MKKIIKCFWFLLIISLFVSLDFSIIAKEGMGQVKSPLRPQDKGHVFAEVLKGASRLRADRAGRIYVLSVNDSSVLVYDKDYHLLKRIGSLGQGPEDLRLPLDFTLDRDGNLIIADTANNRVQILSPEGRAIRSIPFSEPFSVEVLSTNEILVIGRGEGKLIHVFSPKGEWLRDMGEPATTGVERAMPKLHAYLNRGRLFVDPEDNIFWVGSFLPTPTVRKYSPEGKLLLEFHPAGPMMDSLVKLAEQEVKQSLEAYSLGARLIFQEIKVNPETGDIWVLPATAQILIYDARGNFKQEIDPQVGIYPMGAWDILTPDRQHLLVSNMVLGCHLFNLASSS